MKENVTVCSRLKPPTLHYVTEFSNSNIFLSLQDVPTSAPMNVSTRRPTRRLTRRPTALPTKIPTPFPVQQPTVDLTLLFLGTVSFSTAGSTYNPDLFLKIVQAILTFLFNGIFPFTNEIALQLQSLSKPTPTQADTSSQVTTYQFASFVPTSELLNIYVGTDFNSFILDTTEDLIDFLAITINNVLFQGFVFGALSSAQNTFTSVNSVNFIPATPTPV